MDVTGFQVLEYLSHLNKKLSNETLCKWTDSKKNEYKILLADFEKSNGAKSNATTKEKGETLEKIASFLLENCGNLFAVERNVRTGTNEIDNLMKLTPAGQFLLSNGNGILPQCYRSFIGECKNYHRSVDVTYTGKFCSLMLTTECKLGILFSYHGVSGQGWKYGNGLIKKFYLHKELERDRYCIVDFNIIDFRAIAQGGNLLQIVEDKINALKFDTDYSSSLSKHPAEGHL